MASKKYKLLLAGFFMLLATGVFAQPGTIYDSTIIRAKDMPQQNEFWNNAYDFPAKPRNQWEIGISGGAFSVAGDVPAKFPTLGFAAHVRKAFGYVFSLRLQYLNGTGKGLSWVAAENFAKNPAWTRYSAPNSAGGTTIPGRASQPIYYNYKNKTQDLSVQGIITLNNVRFHKAKTGYVVYAGAGLGATAYETMV